MAKAKIKCKGKKKDGTKCNNWALHNSYYCHSHQDQFSSKDIEGEAKVNMISYVIAIIILAIYLIYIYVI